MAKKLDDMNFVEKMTDIINVYGPTNKYNEWLEKSNTKVNPKSFAGKFLKVSFWISTFISTICIVVFMVEAFTHIGKGGSQTEAGQLRIMFQFALLIPLFFTAAIKILQSRYYGLYKLLWLFPLVMWGIILSIFGLGILSDTNPELYNKFWSLFGV